MYWLWRAHMFFVLFVVVVSVAVIRHQFTLCNLLPPHALCFDSFSIRKTTNKTNPNKTIMKMRICIAQLFWASTLNIAIQLNHVLFYCNFSLITTTRIYVEIKFSIYIKQNKMKRKKTGVFLLIVRTQSRRLYTVACSHWICRPTKKCPFRSLSHT